jgi:hypothetical protein
MGLSTTTTTTVVGGVEALTTPNTGASLPLGVSGGLMGLGLALLGVARRMKPRARG